jgi:hypothetical protein
MSGRKATRMKILNRQLVGVHNMAKHRCSLLVAGKIKINKHGENHVVPEQGTHLNHQCCTNKNKNNKAN